MTTSLAMSALKKALEHEKSNLDAEVVKTVSEKENVRSPKVSEANIDLVHDDKDTNVINVDEIINGVRTCLPLLSAAISSDSDDPFKAMQLMIDNVKALTQEIVPQVLTTSDEIFAQKVYSLRSLLISVVAKEYEFTRTTSDKPKEFRKLIQQVISETEIFAEYSDAEFKDLDEHYFRMSLAVAIALKMLHFECDNLQISAVTRNVYTSTVKAFESALLTTELDSVLVLNACRRPIIDLVDGIFDAEFTLAHSSEILGETITTDALLERITRRYEFTLKELIQVIAEGIR